MLEFIKGKLVGKFEDHVVLLSDGFGFFIFVTKSDLLNMPKLGNSVKLYTHLSLKIRQQEINGSIFGFLKKEDRDFFKELLKKDNIGVKIAFSILNFSEASKIKKALKDGDINFLNNCKGVPKKVIKNLFLDFGFIKRQNQVSTEDKKIIEALKKMGYSSKEVKEAISQLSHIKNPAQKLKEALKIINL